jgi:hypothetical protein
MAYSPTSNCNAANYNPNDIPAVYQSGPYAQAEQKAYEQQIFSNRSTGMAGVAGSLGHSNMARSSAGSAVLGNSLQDESHELLVLSETVRNLVNNLRELLFDPVPCDQRGPYENTAQIPTVERNIYTAKVNLLNHASDLEQIISKIGGR